MGWSSTDGATNAHSKFLFRSVEMVAHLASQLEEKMTSSSTRERP